MEDSGTIADERGGPWLIPHAQPLTASQAADPCAPPHSDIALTAPETQLRITAVSSKPRLEDLGAADPQISQTPGEWVVLCPFGPVIQFLRAGEAPLFRIDEVPPSLAERERLVVDEVPRLKE
ncbi:hypothetical protein NM208_g11601 [Fusarium decemcellulare]|uniref:Uncharacterized protein n=1 Tax=Fusarium decemcellulare TaxID=57161 RepID=A0ACC1RUK0_9HYPO|nr:hypothetical protein NM208_g11601 [Fusarium decemcellulare]